MKKRLIALLLVCAMALGLLSGCGKKDPKQEAEQPLATRAEWITLLGEAFGMSDFQSGTPYYKDVPAGDASFPYVQSCHEWGLLGDEETFTGAEPATKEFVVTTAVLAAQISEDTFISPDGTKTATELMMAYAVDHGIVAAAKQGTGLEDTMLLAECETAAREAKKLYLDKELVPYENVVMQEQVVDLRTQAPQSAVLNDNVVTMDEGTADLKVGDVFILPPTPEAPAGTARKVKAISYVDGKMVLETEEPQLQDIYKELDVAAVAVPKVEDIIPYAGTTITGGVTGVVSDETGYSVYKLGNKRAPQTVQGSSFTMAIKLEDGAISVVGGDASEYPGSLEVGTNPENSEKPTSDDEGTEALSNSDFSKKTEPSLDKFKQNPDGWKEKLKKHNKFEAGYCITGTISVSDFYVEQELSLKKFLNIPYGVDKMSIKTNFTATTSLELKGTLTDELTVARVIIPVGPTGVTVDVDFILYAKLSGKLMLKAEVTNSTKLEYEDKNFKKTDNSRGETSAEVAVSIQAGPAIKVTLTAFAIPIIGTKLTVVGEIEASAESIGSVTGGKIEADGKVTGNVHLQEAFQLQADAYVPIITLELGNTGVLADILKVKFKWEIVPKKKSFHKELFKKEIIIWQMDITAEEWNGEIPQKEEESKDPFAQLTLEQLSLTIQEGKTGQIVIATLPADETIADVSFQSMDTSIATVDSNGLVTAVGPGNVQIHVKTTAGKLQICVVDVPETATVKDEHFL